jgi:hypothetical protein
LVPPGLLSFFKIFSSFFFFCFLIPFIHFA